MRIRVLVVALLVLAVPAVATAYDRLVNPFHSCSLSGVPEYDTLQDAVDNANPGDQIGVCPGTYSQNVQVAVNKPGLTLTGIGSVVISPSRADTLCFVIAAPGVTVRYFVVQHCGKAIGVDLGGSGALIQNNTFQLNEVGVTIDGPNAIVQNNLFEDNALGLGVFSNTDGTTIKNNTVRGGSTGILLDGATGVVVNKNAVQGASFFGIRATDKTSDSTISFNSVSSNGTGIELDAMGIGSGNQVTRNVVTKDVVIDCSWDGSGGVTFSRNTCGTENPPGAWD